MHARTNRRLCTFLIFIFGLSWSDLLYIPVAQAAVAQPTSDREEAVERLTRVFDALEKAQNEIPRDTFDPMAIIEKVGRDPVKLFEWVRDNTVLVPYQGVLRDYTGVLMDRVGNSFDRALLLHKLLTLAGQKARLVRGALTEAQTANLLTNLRPIPDLSTENIEDSDDFKDVIKRYAQEFGLDASELLRSAEEIRLDQQKISEKVAQRVADQTKAILDIVGKPDPTALKEERNWQQQALQEHWWVQWSDRPGWVDMDPTRVDAGPGQSLTRAVETTQPDQVGEERHHTVQFRVVLEWAENGKLREQLVLSHDLTPAKLYGQPINFAHVPMGVDLEKLVLDEKEPTKHLKEVIAGETEWLPVLTVGQIPIYNVSFDVRGFIIDVKSPDATTERLGRGLGSTTDKVSDLLGGMLSGGTEQESDASEKPITPSGTELTAEWIEYEIRSPGRSRKTIRRQIFDLLGPATREAKTMKIPEMHERNRLVRGLALTGQTEILPFVSSISPEYIQFRLAESMTKNREVILGLNEATEASSIGVVQPPGVSYSLVVGRRMWSRFGNVTYLDHPNIVSFHRMVGINDGGELVIQNAFDVVENNLAVRPNSNVDSFEVRLEQGILDTNVEASVLVATCKKECERVDNTAELFALSRHKGINWLALGSTDDSGWQSVDLPANARSRIKQELANGYTVLVPQRAVQLKKRSTVAWWRIDPITGETLGIGENGWGAASTGYTVLLSTLTLVTICAYAAVGYMIVAHLHGEEIKIGGNLGQPQNRALMYCVTAILLPAAAVLSGVAAFPAGVIAAIYSLSAGLVEVHHGYGPDL